MPSAFIIFERKQIPKTMMNSRIARDETPVTKSRLPVIGKIRIGEKRVNASGKEYPVSLDYFKAVGQYAAKFDELFQKPQRIQIVFISDNDFESCVEKFEGRDNAGKLAGYGDGKSFFLWDYKGDAGQYAMTENRDDVAAFTKLHAVKWKTILTITFVIPAIRGVFGVWQLTTAGEHSSIGAIRDTFDEIKSVAGTIVNVPFDLCVKKAVSNKPDSKSNYPVISLVPNLSAENMETLRSFYELGMDVKRAGILTDKKLLELGGHPDVVVLPPDETKGCA